MKEIQKSLDKEMIPGLGAEKSKAEPEHLVMRENKDVIEG